MSPISKNNECTYLLPKKKQVCGKKAHYKNNLTAGVWLCNAHKKIVIKKIGKDNELKKIKKVKCTSKDMKILCQRMYIKLNEIKEKKKVD